MDGRVITPTRLCIAMEKFWSLRLKLLKSKAFSDGFESPLSSSKHAELLENVKFYDNPSLYSPPSH